MLGTNPQADQPRRNAAQRGKPLEHANEERRGEARVALQGARDQALLDHELQPLRHAHRPFAAFLHLA